MKIVEKYVMSVYLNRSFSLAAKELFISQPALSTSISRHECYRGAIRARLLGEEL